MLKWAATHAKPVRVVDPGVGSARFLLAAAKRFPKAQLVGMDIDPLATVIARANLAVAGLSARSHIVLHDYRDFSLSKVPGRTLYIGNPPYVRHHQIEPSWKQWLTDRAREIGFGVSQLAGLHVHFFLATVLHATPGDFGSFITAAEWLDVNYGQMIRDLFLADLGGQSITVIEPTARPFVDAASTAVITTFEIGSKPKSIKVRRVNDIESLEPLASGSVLHRNRLETQARWSHLTRRSRPVPPGYIELGELCRVHRGQVTGANRIWIAGAHSDGLPPSVLFRTVTKARELFVSGGVLADSSNLKQVIDLPIDLSTFDSAEKKCIEGFLKYAKEKGADSGYIAENRKAWWSVGLRAPAPILATYMARRPPAFVRNLASARHINIAHGLYPRDSLSDDLLARLVAYLAETTQLTQGRTYSGGLTKFEPREMERLIVPSLEMLRQGPA
jgi:hypothetical protein